MYTATSIDVFIAANAGCLGGMLSGHGVPQSTIPAHYAHLTQIALAFAESFDTEYAAVLPNDLQLADIESIVSETMNGRQPGGPGPLSPSFWTATVQGIIALMTENDATVASNVTNAIPIPAPPSGVPVVQIATVVGATASLKAIVPATGIAAIVDGYATAGDGGGGEFYWDPTSVAVDNVGTIVNPTGHVTAGRWIRILRDGGTLVNVRWFGAKGDFQMFAGGQDATAGDDQVPWRVFAAIDGATYIGKIIQIEGAGVAGADYTGVITNYNSVTHNWTVVPTPSTTVVSAQQLYATDDTAAFSAARDYANLLTNQFYTAGYDLRSAQIYTAHGSFYVPQGLTGAPCGIYLDNATIWGNYEGHSFWDIIPPGQEFSGPRLFTGGVFRGYQSVIKYWSDTFNGLQCNVTFQNVKFQDCRYAVMNARNGNFFLTLNCCEFENSGIAKGFFAALDIIEPQGTSFGALGTIFTPATVLGAFTDGSILVGGTEDGQMCADNVGSIMNIVGGNLSPLVDTVGGAIDGQAWIIARRIVTLNLNGIRLGGESAGLPLLRLEEEANPVTEGSADGSGISIVNGASCVSSNLPCVVFDDAAPLFFHVDDDCSIGLFGGVGVPFSFTQTAYDKLAKRDTNWAQFALNKVGTVGNINQANIAKPSFGSYPSSPLLTLSRLFRNLESREYPSQNADISGNVYDAVINNTNATIADTTLLGLAAKKFTSTDGVNPGVITLQKYFPDNLVEGDYTVTIPYIFKGTGLTTCLMSAWSTDNPSVNFIPLEDTGGAIGQFSFDFHYSPSVVANSHVAQYLVNIPAADPTHYFVMGEASLTPGKFGGQYIPVHGGPIPPYFLHGSATWDPGNLIPTASETKAIIVPGVRLGDVVVGKSFGLDLQGLTLTADVTAADTVTAVLVNNSAGAVDLAVGTVAVDVYHANTPFDPSTLSGQVFYVRSDLGVHVAGGVVTQWDDQAVPAHNLANPNLGQQPTFVAAARNGRPCLRSAGTPVSLASAVGANVVGAGPYTLVVVMQDATGLGPTIPFDYGPGTLANGFCIIINAGNIRTIPHLAVADHVDAAATTNAEAWIATSGAANTLRVNAANQALTNAGTPGMTNPGGAGKISVFASQAGIFWAGDIYEIRLYNRVLSAAEITQIESYVNERYALY